VNHPVGKLAGPSGLGVPPDSAVPGVPSGHRKANFLTPAAVVPGDDLAIAPFQHAVAQLVVKLAGVDDHVAGLDALPLGREQL
jgi:hypothetical protein